MQKKTAFFNRSFLNLIVPSMQQAKLRNYIALMLPIRLKKLCRRTNRLFQTNTTLLTTISKRRTGTLYHLKKILALLFLIFMNELL